MKGNSYISGLTSNGLKLLGIVSALAFALPAFAQGGPSENPEEYNNSVVIEQVGAASKKNKLYILQEGTNLKASLKQNGSNSDIWGYQRGKDSTYTINQTGDGHRVGKYLGGEEYGYTRSASQRGNRNTFTVTQSGEAHILNHVNQDGDDNLINVNQDGNQNRIAAIVQDGSDNSVDINQAEGTGTVTIDLPWGPDFEFEFGSGNKIGAVTQDGDQNSITIDQSGVDNVIGDVVQSEGPGNIMELTQSGGKNRITAREDRPAGTAAAEQLGSYNEAYVTQTGVRNEAEFHQSGDHNYFSLDQTGDDNIARVGTGDPTNDFGQLGSHNVAKIKQISDKNRAVIHNQDGDNSLILITQEGRGEHVARVRTLE